MLCKNFYLKLGWRKEQKTKKTQLFSQFKERKWALAHQSLIRIPVFVDPQLCFRFVVLLARVPYYQLQGREIPSDTLSLRCMEKK